VQALVLDFDGVLADSAPECFEVALRTYDDLFQSESLRRLERKALYRGFLELMPLGNRAEDFGVALAALDAGVALPDQKAYDAFRDARPIGWLEAFHHRFYEQRAAFAEADPAGWRALTPPYAFFLAVLRRHVGRVRLAVATAKDRRSVRTLLVDWGVADLFPEELVLDKETGHSKGEHLLALRDRLGLPFPELSFVDDKVSHLDAVSPLGVRCALAAWGYNGPREQARAHARGYLVCGPADVEALLFGPEASQEGA
jgi:phosphoglycolate phosphatase-like HAD superfamily hydrolase